MIVQPDFADHWKTELIVRICGCESAVRCVLRFWSHCQNRKQWKFVGMTPQMLASICKWRGDENLLWEAMKQTFLEVGEGFVVAHEWKSINARLIHNWSAGTQGGRPKKPKGSQKHNPAETDREDKSREDKKELNGSKNEPSKRGFDFADWFKTLLPKDIDITPSTRSKWAKCFDDLIRLDGRDEKLIADVCRWARKDQFWSTNFMSASKLRDRNKDGILYFDVFSQAMKRSVNGTNGKKPYTSVPMNAPPEPPPGFA